MQDLQPRGQLNIPWEKNASAQIENYSMWMAPRYHRVMRIAESLIRLFPLPQFHDNRPEERPEEPPAGIATTHLAPEVDTLSSPSSHRCLISTLARPRPHPPTILHTLHFMGGSRNHFPALRIQELVTRISSSRLEFFHRIDKSTLTAPRPPQPQRLIDYFSSKIQILLESLGA